MQKPKMEKHMQLCNLPSARIELGKVSSCWDDCPVSLASIPGVELDISNET